MARWRVMDSSVYVQIATSIKYFPFNYIYIYDWNQCELSSRTNVSTYYVYNMSYYRAWPQKKEPHIKCANVMLLRSIAQSKSRIMSRFLLVALVATKLIVIILQGEFDTKKSCCDHIYHSWSIPVRFFSEFRYYPIRFYLFGVIYNEVKRKTSVVFVGSNIMKCVQKIHFFSFDIP